MARMGSHRITASALAIVVFCLRVDAFVLGGGSADKDCRVAFGGVEATDGDSGVLCTDGDPACDADGVADGSCRFAPSLCIGVPVEGCTPIVIESIELTGLSLVPPELPSQPGACGAPLDVAVPVGSAAGVTVVARSGGALRDIDYLNLCCRTGAAPFDAARCALAIDPAIAGCTRPLPAAAVKKFGRARAAILRAAADPRRAKREVRRANRSLDAVRRIARRLADTDACGDALGLVVSHAVTTITADLRAAVPSPASASRRAP